MAETFIGGVPEAEIRATFLSEGLPADAGSDHIGRFVRRLAALIIQRIQRGDRGPFSMFLLGQDVGELVKGCDAKKKPLFSNGNDPLGTGVWLMNSGLANAHDMNIAFEDDGDVFVAVMTAGLGDLPAVTLDLRSPDEPRVSLFPKGCNNPGTKHEIEIADRPIEPERMKAALDKFYDDNLRTPLIAKAGHATSPWGDAAKGVPNRRPEEIIEGRLLPQLKLLFPRHSSRSQPITDDGIIDIALYKSERTASGLPGRRCDYVLELKALANRTANDNRSSIDHGAQIKKGYYQARAYSKREESLRAAVCVYDMRATEETDEECFAGVRDEAAASNIDLWRWKLHRSSEDGRRALYQSVDGAGQ